MADGHKAEGQTFLTVAEAAERLGIGRLRVREAAARGAIPSRRDNEGRLRLDLTRVGAVLAGRPEAGTLLDLLFDEVEEQQADLEARDARIAALEDLAARQDAALDRAGGALEDKAAEAARLAALLDRALGHLETEADARDRLGAVTEAALARLEDTGGRLEASLAQTGRFEALLARAVALAETAGAADPDGARALERTAGRAVDLLDEALARAEAEAARGGRTEALLDRALGAGEKIERDLAQRQAEVDAHRRALDQALSVSERALAVANAGTGTPRQRRGFFRRLLGF